MILSMNSVNNAVKFTSAKMGFCRRVRTAWRFTRENVRNFNVRNVAGSAKSLFSYAIANCAFADPASKSSVIYSTRLRQFAEAATVRDVGRRAKSYVSQNRIVKLQLISHHLNAAGNNVIVGQSRRVNLLRLGTRG